MSVTVFTEFPVLYTVFMNFKTVMANVVTDVSLLMIIPFVAFCTVIISSKECWPFRDDIKVIVMMVQVDFLLGGWAFIYNGVKVHF